MREDQFVLHFETVPNRYPDTEVAARALLDWVELVRRTIHAVDPDSRFVLEIAGARAGSSRFPQLLRWLDRQAGDVRSAWEEYPHLKSVIAGGAHTFYTSAIAAGVTLAMAPTEQVVRLSDHDRALIIRGEERAAADPAVREANQRFYRTLESDTSITGVGVAEDWDSKPSVIVPRSQFSERGGLWELEEVEADKRRRYDVWDVVLLRPNLVSKPRAWTFMRDGLPFTAKVTDTRFLTALKDGRLPLTLQEGVTMRVEVEYVEELDGQVWAPIKGSRRVVRVLSPTPRT